MSVQIWEAARAALPGPRRAASSRATSRELGDWLRENLYALGRKLTPKETLERVVGGPLDPEPYLRYLREKYLVGAAAEGRRRRGAARQAAPAAPHRARTCSGNALTSIGFSR